MKKVLERAKELYSEGKIDKEINEEDIHHFVFSYLYPPNQANNINSTVEGKFVSLEYFNSRMYLLMDELGYISKAITDIKSYYKQISGMIDNLTNLFLQIMKLYFVKFPEDKPNADYIKNIPANEDINFIFGETKLSENSNSKKNQKNIKNSNNISQNSDNILCIPGKIPGKIDNIGDSKDIDLHQNLKKNKKKSKNKTNDFLSKTLKLDDFTDKSIEKIKNKENIDTDFNIFDNIDINKIDLDLDNEKNESLNKINLDTSSNLSSSESSSVSEGLLNPNKLKNIGDSEYSDYKTNFLLSTNDKQVVFNIYFNIQGYAKLDKFIGIEESLGEGKFKYLVYFHCTRRKRIKLVDLENATPVAVHFKKIKIPEYLKSKGKVIFDPLKIQKSFLGI
jgi:hypothetical protein